ncbi:unnamed protein product [Anisakis simplex]|uniref:DDE_Tnp_1_7 domain-containing protein n=1 Tax=Anisakis simplex TaxID=6269 RepID=A0A0M3K227_ANISI|nr:unnamed protein product [Anisakis simplex]
MQFESDDNLWDEDYVVNDENIEMIQESDSESLQNTSFKQPEVDFNMHEIEREMVTDSEPDEAIDVDEDSIEITLKRCSSLIFSSLYPHPKGLTAEQLTNKFV